MDRALVARFVALAMCTLGWTLALEPHARRVLLLLDTPLDTPWPLLLDHPLVVAVAWLAGLIGLFATQLTRTRVLGVSTWFVAAIVLALHRVTGADATFYGGIWVSAWWLWLVVTERRDPARARLLAPRLATWVAAALFVPPGAGKLLDAYATGAAFEAMMGQPPPPLLQLLGIEPTKGFFALMGRGGTMVELSAITWVVLPPRIVFGLLLCITTGMILLWNIHLASILLPVGSLAVAAWPVAPRSSATID